MKRTYWIFSTLWEDQNPSNKYVRHAVIDDDRMLAKLEQCKPIRGRPWRLESSRKTRLEDLPFTFMPVMSRRAVTLLKSTLGVDGEFHPVVLYKNGEPANNDYFIYNCLRSIRAADRRVLGADSFDRSGAIRPLIPLRLDYDLVPKGIHAFRCRESPTELLVSVEVRDQLLESGLTGWTLRDPNNPNYAHSMIFPKRH